MRQLPAPFVIYADFEAITRKVEGPSNTPSISSTKTIQIHEPCGWAYKVVCQYDDYYSRPLKLNRGENAVKTFLDSIFETQKELRKILSSQF